MLEGPDRFGVPDFILGLESPIIVPALSAQHHGRTADNPANSLSAPGIIA
jgi:hypothetical protein